VEEYFFEEQAELDRGPAGGKIHTRLSRRRVFSSERRAADYKPPPAMDVLVYAGEENFADTMSRSAQLAGADMNKISRIDSVCDGRRRVRIHFGYLDTLRTDKSARDELCFSIRPPHP
jgi:hypothetical protein